MKLSGIKPDPPGVWMALKWVGLYAQQVSACLGELCDQEHLPHHNDGSAQSDIVILNSPNYSPRTQEKIRGATMVASLSTMNLGVEEASLPQVIFSLGTAPE